jgi:hypothetical protein
MAFMGKRPHPGNKPLGLRAVGQHGRHPTPNVQNVHTPQAVPGRNAVAMAEGMNLDKPNVPAKNRFQTADAFRIRALQRGANGGV